ncbi:MAG: MobA/MobL family protein [Pseudomonadota bacterium]
MAIYSLNHKSVGRATHAAGTASAHVQYIMRVRAASEIIAHGMPEKVGPAMRWMDDQEQASRKNARVIDKVMVALPIELDAVQRAELIRDFGEAVTGNRTPWVAAMHDMGKDAQNPHAHFIFRDRDIETGKRVLRLSDSKRDREKAGLEPNGTDWLRQVWELKANAALERAGREERIDRRTLEAQGIDREPGLHVGPKANELEREGKVPPSQVRYDENGREIRYPEIDGGTSRATHNNRIQVRNRIALDGKAANDDFKKEVGRAWDVLKRKQVRDLERAKDQQSEAEKRERDVLEKRQRERQAREHATDERKRPKGIRGLFARITGRKQKVEAEIAKAQRGRIERNRVEWEKLETRQIAQREKMLTDLQRVFEQEKLLFRVEAKRIHQRALSPEYSRSPENDRDRDKDRDDDDGRDGFGGPPGPKLRLDPPGR